MLYLLAIVVCVITLILLYRLDIRRSSGYVYWDFSTYAAIDGPLILLVAVFATFCIFNLITDSEVTEAETTALVSIHSTPDEEEATSEYFLFLYCSEFNKNKYIYYVESDDGGYVQQYVSADDSTVYEVDNLDNAYIVKYSKANYSKINPDVYFWLTFRKDGSFAIFNNHSYYHIYVPTGTICVNENT